MRLLDLEKGDSAVHRIELGTCPCRGIAHMLTDLEYLKECPENDR